MLWKLRRGEGDAAGESDGDGGEEALLEEGTETGEGAEMEAEMEISVPRRRRRRRSSEHEWDTIQAEMWYVARRRADEAEDEASGAADFPAERNVNVKEEALGTPSVAAPQQRARAWEEDKTTRMTAQPLEQRRVRACEQDGMAARRLAIARPASAPAQPGVQSPPSPALRPPASAPPCLETARAASRASTGVRPSRREGRAALGRALVSVRDRAESQQWLDGVERMRENGENVGAFYEILSLGLQARTGVRDV
ncbi:hypothetical protein G6514_006125 [Epicoccum nigrum]|nr:hypothetical protein G6514_006125 [Epicoccum nigrum]